IALGSLDPESGYRMLVTATNRGAAIQRIEMSSARYSDLHDRGGYLGHLELAADDKPGLLVRVVGPGTPAAKAGLQAGDRLLEAGTAGKRTQLKAVQDLGAVLDEARPGRPLEMVAERDGQQQTLSAELGRRPLEVVRPEAENVILRSGALPQGFTAPPSFLMTLDSFDNQEVAADAEELRGVDLHWATWRIVQPRQPEGSGDSVTFE